MAKLIGWAKTTRWLNNWVRRNPFYYPRALETFRRTGAMPLEAREAFHHERLRHVLQRARGSHYGQRVGGTDRIQDWPILEKDALRTSPDEFGIGRNWLSLAAGTGGTTGSPLSMFRSLVSVVTEQAALDYVVRKKGVNLRSDRVAVLRGDSIKDASDRAPPFSKLVGDGQRLLLSSHHLSRASVASYVEDLVQFSPKCLMAYPSSVEALCMHVRDAGLKLNIPVVVTSSEVLKASSWKLVQAVLGADVIDRYGLAERTAFAFAMDAGQYYFLAGYGYVELQPVRRDDQYEYCDIIGTPFWNSSMAFVRYRTGDLAMLKLPVDEKTRERVALGMDPFAGIEGRMSDYLVAPDGARVIAMNHLPREVKHIIQMQIVQESLTSVLIRIVPDVGFGPQDEHTILGNARQKLPQTMTVIVEVVTQLERTAAGKTPFIIRREGIG